MTEAGDDHRPARGQTAGSRTTAVSTEVGRPEAPESEPNSAVLGSPEVAFPDAAVGADALRFEGDGLVRRLHLPSGSMESRVELPAKAGFESPPENSNLNSLWLRAYLCGARPRPSGTLSSPLFVPLTSSAAPAVSPWAFRQLAAEAGRTVETELAVDVDEAALAVFAANLGAGLSYPRSVASLVDFRVRGRGTEARFAYPPEILDDLVAAAVKGVDLVTAGPPCQGPFQSEQPESPGRPT